MISHAATPLAPASHFEIGYPRNECAGLQQIPPADVDDRKEKNVHRFGIGDQHEEFRIVERPAWRKQAARRRENRHLREEKQVDMVLQEIRDRIRNVGGDRRESGQGNRRRGDRDADDQEREWTVVALASAGNIIECHASRPQGQCANQRNDTTVDVQQRVQGLVTDLMHRQPRYRRFLAAVGAIAPVREQWTVAVLAGGRSFGGRGIDERTREKDRKRF